MGDDAASKLCVARRLSNLRLLRTLDLFKDEHNPSRRLEIKGGIIRACLLSTLVQN